MEGSFQTIQFNFFVFFSEQLDEIFAFTPDLMNPVKVDENNKDDVKSETKEPRL